MMTAVQAIERSSVSERALKAAQLCLVGVAFFLPMSTSLTDILFLLAAFLVLVSGTFFSNIKNIIKNPIVILFITFFILAWLGLVWTVANYHDAFQVLHRYSRYGIAIFLIPALMDERWRNYIINGLIAGVVIIVLLTLADSYGLVHWHLTHASPHDATLFKNHIETGFVVNMGLYFLYLQYRQYPALRWLFLAAAVLCCFFIFFVATARTAYLLFFLLAAIIAFQEKGWKGLVYGFFAAILLSILVYSISPVWRAQINQTISTTLEYHGWQSQSSAGERITFWQQALMASQSHLLFGSGTGSVHERFKELQQYQKSYKISVNPHNEYLDLLVQFGLVGLGLYIAILITSWRFAKQLAPQMKKLLQMIVICYAIGTLVNSWLLDTTEGHFFALFVMLAVASAMKKAPSDFSSTKNHLPHAKTLGEG